MTAVPEHFPFVVDYCRRLFREWLSLGWLSPDEYHKMMEHFGTNSGQADMLAEEQGRQVAAQVEGVESAGIDPTAVESVGAEDAERQTRVASEFLSEKLCEFHDDGILTSATFYKLRNYLKNSDPTLAELITDNLHERSLKHQSNKQAAEAGLVERLLDPKSLQTLMMSGAGLLVLGFVVWLWSIGLFENPLIVAVTLGVTNLTLISAGVAIARATRHWLAGRGLALLGCLTMPLNLWFYDSQGLISISQGGSLWIPALICCVIYALVVFTLKDPLFVYALVGGIVMTGLLFLADQSVERFWEIISPSVLLVVVGAICIHLERLFDAGAEVFKRKTFGQAFFRAGHVVLAAGLAILFSGQIAGLFYDAWFAEFNWFPLPDLAAVRSVQLTALLLICGAIYTYIYSYVAVRRLAADIYSAMFLVVWGQIILLDMWSVDLTADIMLLVLSSTALLASLFGRIAGKQWSGVSESDSSGTVQQDRSLLSLAGKGLASLVSMAGVIRFVYLLVCSWGGYTSEVSWEVLSCALLVSGISGLFSIRKFSQELYLLGLTAVSLTAALLGILLKYELELTMSLTIPGAMAVVAAVVFTRSKRDEAVSIFSASAVPAVCFLFLLGGGAWGAAMLPFSDFSVVTPWRAILAGELAVFFLLMGKRSESKAFVALSGICCWAMSWQIFGLCDVSQPYAAIFSANVVGLLAVIAGCLFGSQQSSLASGLKSTGAGALVLGGVAGVLMAWNHIASENLEWAVLILMIGQCLTAFLGAILSGSQDYKKTLLVTGVMNLLTGFVVINQLSPFTLFQRLEILSIVVGSLLLISAHLGWRREGSKKDDLVSLNLFLGSFCLASPLIIGLLEQRFMGASSAWGWTMFHEVGTLSIGLILLGAGILCRIRMTTLAGAATLAIYLLSLCVLIRFPEQLQNVAVYMMVGGASFFTTAILLSVYRDRLVSMPERIRQGEGVFRVLKWR